MFRCSVEHNGSVEFASRKPCKLSQSAPDGRNHSDLTLPRDRRSSSFSKQWVPTTFEYGEDGVSIRVLNVYAWVCQSDGEASFTPETVDELIATVRELVTPAKRARERHSMPAEYIVRVA